MDRVAVLLFASACVATAGCAVDKTGLGRGTVEDAGDATDFGTAGTDLGTPRTDLGTPGTDLGVRVDLGTDLGLADGGCTATSCGAGRMCVSGTCMTMPDAGCAMNGCGGSDTCHPDGTCGPCDPTLDGCCPACTGSTTCNTTTHACISASACGGEGEPCCVSTSPCGSHLTCDGWGGMCVHCGRSGEPCCGLGGCDSSLRCSWGGTCG